MSFLDPLEGTETSIARSKENEYISSYFYPHRLSVYIEKAVEMYSSTAYRLDSVRLSFPHISCKIADSFALDYSGDNARV